MKLKPSDLKRKAQRLLREGRLPSLSQVVEAIREVKRDAEFTAPVVRDALIRDRKGGKQ